MRCRHRREERVHRGTVRDVQGGGLDSQPGVGEAIRRRLRRRQL